MRWKLSKSNYPLLIMAVFAMALVLAGGLLYRWINRASIADREQQEEFLNAAMRSFRGEFDAPLLEIRASFRPAPRAATPEALDQYLASFYSQWRSNDANGALVAGLSVATVDAEGKLQFRSLDPVTGKFKPAPLPKSLEVFRPRIERIETSKPGEVIFYRANAFPFAVDGSHPMIVVPIAEPEGHWHAFERWAVEHSAEGMRPPLAVFTENEQRIRGPLPADGKPLPRPPARPPVPGAPGLPRGWCFLELNLTYLKERVLPQLLERSFGGAGLANYRVAVLAGEPPEIIYSSEPGLTAASFASPDGDAVLFASIGGFGAMFRSRVRRFQPLARAIERMHVLAGRVPLPGREAASGDRLFAPPGAWVLAVKNKAGSIDALVARARRRNLALGFGVLFLLALSMASLVISTHRARELARREMEFVAGVSHEFRTPLASIQSAGFNLASGVVRKPSRVQEYGALVQNEARRLTDMIEQVMSYAGIQSGGKRYEPVAVQVPAIVDRALAEYAPTFRDTGWTVEKNIAADLPLVLAEPSALESALKNLFANSIKYAASGRWLRVSATRIANGSHAEVEVSVEDRGPGIDPADLPHIFEPFYRGRGVLASTVPGAGLGLSIVKRHVEAQGGRVSVESRKGSGARFALRLPAIAEPQRKAV
ncbi:MAG TPA: HAMP domain-containing sensor histidine kinase [Terriglobia bacterium]|nr:HAMP domain-containing sensor histidine kinase [Terriglobia bacterium]